MEKKATESMENKNYIIIKIDDPNTNKVNFEEVVELPETLRGDGGFGSTGK